MSKKTKYRIWGSGTIEDLRQKAKQVYVTRYYNLWMNKFEWKGLDKELASQQENFIMRKFWSDGTIAARPIPNTDLMVFTPWALQNINCYDLPETIRLVNLHGVSFIPTATQVVNKDAVIGWCTPSHKSINAVADYYIDRMVQVDMVINTNLTLQKLPFLVGVDEADADKMEDIVQRILNDEVVVFADLQSLSNIQSVATNTPYVIDRLSAYKRELEQQLMTFLGIDNNGSETLEKANVNADAVNANNALINANCGAIENEINKFLDNVNRVFGRSISIKCREEKVQSFHEAQPQPQPQEDND